MCNQILLQSSSSILEVNSAPGDATKRRRGQERQKGRENERLAVRGRVPGGVLTERKGENASTREKGEMRSHKSNGRKTMQGTGETFCVARIFRFLPGALSPLMKTGESVGRRPACVSCGRGPSAETALSPSLPPPFSQS